jgi:hypothetical protein
MARVNRAAASTEPPGYLKAGITSRAKRVRFSFMIFFGVPSGHETIACSSPGYRRSPSFR